MQTKATLATLVLGLALPGLTLAGELTVGEAWARATPPGSEVAAAYLAVDNQSGKADRLLSVSSDAAARTEVHETRREGEMVKMHKVEPLLFAGGERRVFQPGGTHVMLMGLKRPLREGEHVTLVLLFEHAGERTVEATVLAAGAAGPHDGQQAH